MLERLAQLVLTLVESELVQQALVLVESACLVPQEQLAWLDEAVPRYRVQPLGLALLLAWLVSLVLQLVHLDAVT